MWFLINSSAPIGGKFICKKNPLQDLFSSLNAVISTNESTQYITGHVIYNLAYTYKFQLKTTQDQNSNVPCVMNHFQQRKLLKDTCQFMREKYFNVQIAMKISIPKTSWKSILPRNMTDQNYTSVNIVILPI